MKRIIVIIWLLFISATVFSQRTIHGVVRDGKETLVGVNVVILNSNNRVLVGVSTDVQGEYYLRIPETKEELTMSFSFIGYKSKRIPYKGQQTLNVKLEADAQLIDEVVVKGKQNVNSMGVAYKNLASSTERMSMEGATEFASSIGDALQGHLANVDIVSASGAPGSGMSIRIRGVASLSTSAQPLIVLDGIPQETQISETFDFATATEEDLGGLVNISPSDIASIEVLKDAGATAIWGARGANGVLLITTKQGTQSKMKFSIGQKFNINFEPRAVEMLSGDQYVTLMQDELWNRGLETKIDGVLEDLAKNQINFNPRYIYWREFNQNTDWLKEISKTGLVSETNFSVSGGGERASYRFSASYLSEEGTTQGFDFTRLTSRLNLNYRFSDRFRIVTGIAFSQGDRNQPYLDDVRAVAIRKMSNQSPFLMEADGVTRTSAYFTPNSTIQANYPNTYNAVAMARESKWNEVNRAINLNLDLLLDITKALRYNGTFGFNTNSISIDGFLPEIVTGAQKTQNIYNQARSRGRGVSQLYISNKLIYNKTFKGGHNVVFTAAMDLTDFNRANQSYGMGGGATPEISSPGSSYGNMVEFSSEVGQNRDFGLIGNLNYTYKGRYILGASVRRSGSSKMIRDNRWGTFPSASLGWRVENESFMKKQKFIDELKFRGSWGLNGQMPDGVAYAYAGRFSPEGSDYGNESAVGPTSMHLTNLTYQVVEKYNFGIDIVFLKRMIALNFDWYRNNTRDLLLRNVPVPGYTGYTNVAYSNSGEMRNEGWEFRGSINNVLPSKDFRLTFNFNIASNENSFLKLPDKTIPFQYPDKIENGTYALTAQEGRPMGAFYGFRYNGVYKDQASVYARDAGGNLLYDVAGKPVQMVHEDRMVMPGDAIYQDVNKDGVINKYDIVYLGSCLPKFTGGAGFTFAYKSLALVAFFHTRIGFDIVNRTRIDGENMHTFKNQTKAVLNRWRVEGDETNIPKALHNRGYNWLGSDRFIEDGSFVRLKQLTLRYSLPKHWMTRWKMEKLNVYATGYDLFTFTNYSGQDPEVNVNGGMSEDGRLTLMGEDKAKSPRPRKVMIGIELEF